MSGFCIRPARPGDAGAILGLIKELAEYENLADRVEATEQGLAEQLFEKKSAEVLIAEYEETPIGYALFFGSFSTFLGKPGVYLEDIYIRPEYRGNGYGRAMLKRLAKLGLERGCGRLEWACLDWNRPSIDFYLSLGAEPMTGWTTYRLSGKELEKLAE